MGEPILWKYKTTHGDDAVTDRWEDIPAAQRTHAQPFTTAATTAPFVALDKVPGLAPLRFDPLSFGGGVLLGAALAMLLARSRRSVLGIALAATVIVVGMGAYLGFLRRQAGLSGAALTSPQEIIGNVHDAAGGMKDHFGQQQKTLEQIEAGAK